MPDNPKGRPVQKPHARHPAAAPNVTDDLKKRLSDEYKILQDKIDKIGAFRFTIKGWAVAAVGAAGAAASATTNFAATIFVSIGLAISVVFFFKFELEQVRLSRLFGSLAGKIEQVFGEIDKGTVRRQFSSPIIGTEIVEAKRNRTRPGRFRWWMVWRYFAARHRPARKAWRRELKEDWAASKSAHITFYIFLFIFAFMPVAAKHHEVMNRIASALRYYSPPRHAFPLSIRSPDGDSVK